MALEYGDVELSSGDMFSGAGTYTTAPLNINTPGATRHVIVFVKTYFVSGGSITGVTVGGVTADLVHALSTGDSNDVQHLYVANVPTGTTAQAAVTSTAATYDGAIWVYTVPDGEPTLNDTFFTTTSSSGVFSGSIDVAAAGDFAIGFLQGSGDGTGVTWNAGLTENDDAIQNSFLVISGASENFASANAALTVTATIDGWGYAFAEAMTVWSLSAPAGGTSYPRAFAAVSSSTVTILGSRTLNRAMNIASVSASAIARLRRVNRALGASSSSSVVLSRLRRLNRAFNAVSSSLINVSRSITFNRAFSALSTSAVSLSASVAGAVSRALNVASTSAVSITRVLRLNRTMTVSSLSGSTFERTKHLYRAMSVASTSAAALTATIVAVGISRTLVIASNSAVAISRTLNSVRTFFAAFSSTVTLSPEYSPIEGIRNVAFTAEQSETHLSFYPVETTVQVTIIDTNGVIDS